MANNWDVKWNGRERTEADLRRLERMLGRSGELIKEFTPRIQKDIVTRTMQGQDINDRDFVPYAETTAMRKSRHTPVTMSDTGTMLHALSWEQRGPFRARIWIRAVDNRDAIGSAHQHGVGRVPQRQWFGYSPSQKQALDRDTHKWFVDWVRRNIKEFRPVSPVTHGTAWSGGKPD